MAVKKATHVRMAPSRSGGKHEHIQGVCTDSGTYYRRNQVVDSLDAGDSWKTLADGLSARIRKLSGCRHPGCRMTPYITTDADDRAPNNLDNLPRC